MNLVMANAQDWIMVSDVMPYTGWFKALIQYLMMLLVRSFGAEYVNSGFSSFPSGSHRLYADVALHCWVRETVAPR
jgi:hypothetical protein